jgi:hypothetical protein
MKTIKFVVKLNRGSRAAEYVQRVDPTLIHMTTNPKLALLMSRLTARLRRPHLVHWDLFMKDFRKTVLAAPGDSNPEMLIQSEISNESLNSHT